MLARVTSELKFHRWASRMHSEQPVKTPAYSILHSSHTFVLLQPHLPQLPLPSPTAPSPLGLR